MDDSALDLPSSPDPLADEDEVPSSVRPGTRRTTLSLPQPDHTLLSSSPRRSSASQQSPRKRTFELDVGDENKPQRILVTVEAEEALRRGIVPRRLFVPSSPTRGSHLTKNTTTTTVPLNDGDTKTPRRRGRPRRTSNGTPMPSARKRSGTPIQQPAAKHARRSGEMESGAAMSSDAPVDTVIDDGDDTPKAKPKAKPKTRKTPKKAVATPSAPSSQVSGKTTGRKRGRPRKSLMPEEIVDLDKARAEASMLASLENMNERESASEVLSDFVRGGSRQGDMRNDGAPSSDFPMEEQSDATPRANMYRPREAESRQRTSVSRTSSHQEMATDDDFMSEDPPGVEQHSDMESDMDHVEGVTYNGGDTLAHASDFSMIAVESLPSFQANISGIPEEPEEMGQHEEMGEETSQIIMETLKSLRESTQANKSHQSSNHPTADMSTADQEQIEEQNRSLGDSSHNSIRALSKSPRRPRSLPLNRRVFAGKAPHVDDSFSTIPDSVLHATTPGRISMKPVHAHDQTENEEAYDDSFSEIPDVVLEAATPKPASRTAMPSQITTENQSTQQNSNTSSRSPASNLGSARLPTPDDTSSSNAGSFRVDDNATGPGAAPPVTSNPHTDILSSPPAMSRPRAMDYGPSELQDDMDGTPRGERSSPGSSPSAKHPSDKAPSEPSKSLEALHRSRRPTLSPIVRVGRTLQNVMSDRSSPDGRESSLGSPFRGSYSNEVPRQQNSDHSRQSSAARSPNSANRHHQRNSYVQPSFGSIAALAQTIGPAPGHGQRRSSQDPGNGYADGSLGSGMRDSTHTTSFRDSIHNSSNQFSRHNESESQHAVNSAPKTALASDNEIDWLAEVDSPEVRNTSRSYLEQAGSRIASVFSYPGTTSQDTSAHAGEVDRMQEDEVEESGDGADDGGMRIDDDEFDLWDIEASRPSPGKTLSEPQPEPGQEEEPGHDHTESDAPPRRNKVTSPWRRSGRRLIYQDDITSALQIEIGEDSGRSEADEGPTTRRRREPRIPRPSILELQPLQDLSSREPSLREHDSPQQNVRESSSPEAPLPEQYSSADPSPERDVEEQQPWEPENDREKLPAFSERRGSGSQSRNLHGQSSEGANVSEYSMVPQQTDEAEAVPPATQKKPAPAKSRFFGGFDILSFFSSPATLPQKDASETKPTETPSRPQQPRQLVTKQPVQKETQPSLWSTGLFRPIPQKEFRPSPERRIDLFSPGPSQRPNNTVPDVRELSPSESPVPSSSSAAPSTPERQEFSPIEQKKNFTPRQGQPGSLFYLNRPFSPATRNENTNGFLQVPSDQQDPDSSIMTEGSEYERLPPRDKPSRWDRTLSPSKSCFRSPLKPTTPGRVVAFTGNATSPLAQQTESRNDKQLSGNADDAVSQRPSVRPSIENRGAQPQVYSENIPPNVVADEQVSSEDEQFEDEQSEEEESEEEESEADEESEAEEESEAGSSVQSWERGQERSKEEQRKRGEELQRQWHRERELAWEKERQKDLERERERERERKVIQARMQAQAQSQPRVYRTSASASASASASTSSNPTFTTTNTNTNTTNSSSSPTPLSPTTWTKQHWIRLDEILQRRRTTDPARFRRHFSLPIPTCFSPLVGQAVTARDARLVLEPWHLDVVEAFRLEVGGWDDRNLAKRLFALVVGEERRRDGRVVSSSSSSSGGGGSRRGWGR